MSECTADDVNHKGLCKIKNGKCTHVCDGLVNKECQRFKNDDDGKKTCTNKFNNPCKKCKPKTCGKQEEFNVNAVGYLDVI